LGARRRAECDEYLSFSSRTREMERADESMDVKKMIEKEYVDLRNTEVE
jgi:hypothetical protein